MSTPKYVARIARLPEVLALLAQHPHGIALDVLAAEAGVPAGELREDLLAYFTADDHLMFGLTRPEVLEFTSAEGEEEDPNTASIVKIVGAPADLGVEHLDAGDLALVYTAATSLLEVEPDNAELAEAIEAIAGTLYGEPDRLPDDEQRFLEPLRRAVREHRRVRIVYSRAWHAGVTERVIEPYRLVQTRRGWEIDAGPEMRTYLLSHLRSVEPVPETFEPPVDLDARLHAQRATTRVRIELPHGARWAADMYAEQVSVVEDGLESFVADLELLPPVGDRVGLIMLAGGEDTRVLSPATLVQEGPRVAAHLLAHHGQARLR